MVISIKHTTIKINRREANDKFALTAQISKKLKAYITEHFGFFSSFDKVIVYNDNGQQELILITNKTVDKKSSHNPYMQDYARFFVQFLIGS